MSAHRLTDEELTRAAMEVHPSSLEHNEAHATDAEVRTHIPLLDSWIQAANLLAAWRRGEIELDVRPGLNGWVMSGLGWAALEHSYAGDGDDVDPVRRAAFYEAIRTLDKPLERQPQS